jgi:hypothetical protein
VTFPVSSRREHRHMASPSPDGRRLRASHDLPGIRIRLGVEDSRIFRTLRQLNAHNSVASENPILAASFIVDTLPFLKF